MGNTKKAVRIILTQNTAHYRKAGTVRNGMTYPLPPMSTVVGALHAACGYDSYHEMDVSIQGGYETMANEVFTASYFLNSLMPDRNILVKMYSANALCNSYTEVAKAVKSQGSSFVNGLDVHVFRPDLLQEFQMLYACKDNHTSEQKETYALYRNLVKDIRHCETLYGVRLILHISSNDATMQDILDHVHDLQSIGRREDFVQIEDARMVELVQQDLQEELISDFAMYADYQDVKDGYILTQLASGKQYTGTVYYLGKKYAVSKSGKRVFPDRRRILYGSYMSSEQLGGRVWMDTDMFYEKPFLVNLL